jgi:hypothetical protein
MPHIPKLPYENTSVVGFIQESRGKRENLIPPLESALQK